MSRHSVVFAIRLFVVVEVDDGVEQGNHGGPVCEGEGGEEVPRVQE